jgi:hypothetical protein
MHYIVGGRVLKDTHEITNILRVEDHGFISYKIFIQNDSKESYVWKEFNSNMPISIEYNIDFD